MTIKEVKTGSEERQFLDMVQIIYHNDPNYVRHLDNDIRAVFNPAENNFFRHGTAIRWLLLNDSGLIIGRIAAFIDRKQMNDYGAPTGGIGFFE